MVSDSIYTARSVLGMMRPHRVNGVDKIRVGRFFDGGYVMLDRFRGVEAAYSLGINDDVSWDQDMARLGIPIFQYDHTIEQLPAQHPLFHWEKKCISGADDAANNVVSLATLIAKNGHGGANNLLLKCDIEGAEWHLLEHTPNAILAKFSQIVLEIHGMEMLAETHHADNMRKAMQNLTASHRVVHVHANNFSPFVTVGGIPVPNVMELTLARMDLGDFAVSEETFPTPLDMPCHSLRPDLYLGRFAFD